MGSTQIELVKAEALRRLRLYLKQSPSWFHLRAKAKRDEALRAYLAEIAQAHLTALLDGHVLPSMEDLGAWFDGVLNDAVENAGGHADVAAAAEQHRDSLFDIVRAGFLSELALRQRRWEAAGTGGSMITPEMLAEEADAKRELEEALARKKQDRKVLMPPSPEAPQPEPEPPRLTWDKDVSIIFLSEERVQVKRGDEYSTLNYAEFGFEDRRNGKPDQAWVLLREMAENKGVLRKPERRVPEAVLKPARDRDKELHRALEVQARQWAKTQKHVETIRKRLREHFRILGGDPIPSEPPLVCRRPVNRSYATLAGQSSEA